MTFLSQGLGRQRGGLLLPLMFTVAASLKHFKLWFVVFFCFGPSCNLLSDCCSHLK